MKPPMVYPSARYELLAEELQTIFLELRNDLNANDENINDDSIVIAAALLIIADSILDAAR